MRKITYLILVLIILLGGTSAYSQSKVVIVPLHISQTIADYYPYSRVTCFNIPDAQADSGIMWIIPESAGIVKKVQVVLHCEHTLSADLDVSLSHKGTHLDILFSDVGLNSDGFLVHIDDDTPISVENAPIVNAYTPINGRYNPEGNNALPIFNGEDASSSWYLNIRDNAAGDIGKCCFIGLYITD